MKKALLFMIIFFNVGAALALDEAFLTGDEINQLVKGFNIRKFYSIILQNDQQHGLDTGTLSNINQIFLIAPAYNNTTLIDELDNKAPSSQVEPNPWIGVEPISQISSDLDLLSQLDFVRNHAILPHGYVTNYLARINLYETLNTHDQIIEFVFSPDSNYDSCISVLYDLHNNKVSEGTSQACFYNPDNE